MCLLSEQDLQKGFSTSLYSISRFCLKEKRGKKINESVNSRITQYNIQINLPQFRYLKLRASHLRLSRQSLCVCPQKVIQHILRVFLHISIESHSGGTYFPSFMKDHGNTLHQVRWTPSSKAKNSKMVKKQFKIYQLIYFHARFTCADNSQDRS